MPRLWSLGCVTLAVIACKPATKVPDFSNYAVAPPPGAMHRLSVAQYTNSIHDLLSTDIVVPSSLEPDVTIDGFVALGMATATISPTGVTRYEKSALAIAAQAIATDARRKAFVSCTPSGVSDQQCLTTFVQTFGKRAWRRPLTDAEVQTVVAIGVSAAGALNDPWQGIAAAMTQLLESPNFLFRVELGEPDPAVGALRYNNYEMAGRVAAFLTNSTPDDELLAAADKGELVANAGLQKQIERLLASPKARVGMRNFFTELYNLTALDNLNQDPTIYKVMSSDLGPSAREETLEDLERLVFDQNADFRTFFTGRSTNVNRRLAAVYDIQAPSLDAFGSTTLSSKGVRVGFLGQVSFLAAQAHPTSTSAVLRGKFIRTVLLCDTIPPPPVGVNTGLEPLSTTVHTMRDRSAAHLMEGSTCYTCHSQMDPIGLGLENFDAVGAYRTIDNGVAIDPSGELDGKTFKSPVDLAKLVVASPKFPKCFAKELFEYATGTTPTSGDVEFVHALGDAFVTTNFRVKEMMEIIAMSSGFRRAGVTQ